MRFRFELKKKKKDVGLLRRQLCFFMLCIFLLTGCGSIILNGDLSFSANAPVQPMPMTAKEVQD